jgi:hypothetical protein
LRINLRAHRNYNDEKRGRKTVMVMESAWSANSAVNVLISIQS